MDEDLLQSQVDLIREVFLYSNRFDGKCFVIQIASNIVEDDRFPTLVRDLAILQKSGIRLVLVPGAGKRIDEVLKSYGVETPRVGGVRISPSEHMGLIKMAAFDIANMVMTQLSSQKVDAVIGNWVTARALGVRDGVDFQDTGMVAKVNVPLLEKIMAEGLVPILPCIGWSSTGVPYNLSSLELATHLAVQLKSEKMFYVSDGVELRAESYALPGEGIVVRDGAISRFDTQAAERFLEANPAIGQPMVRDLLKSAARAAREGVERVHLLNGRVEGVILKEIFSSVGQGTMVHANPFESIRPMRAEDVAQVLHLMEPNIEKGILLKRSADDLLEAMAEFHVYENDGTVRGCGALHPYGGEGAEIAGIAVDPNFNHLGIGQKLVRFLVERARQSGIRRVFLLTTQTGDFFESTGFRKGGLADLPAEKRENYNAQRKSRVYYQDLA